MIQQQRNSLLCFLNSLMLILLLGVVSVQSQDGCAHVVDATASQSAGGTWDFSAAVSSTEIGWDKYANAWKVENLDGDLLGTRELLHPHQNEQPFTRSLSGVVVPDDVSVVVLSAQDSVLGYCGDSFGLLIQEMMTPTEGIESTNTTIDETETISSSNTSGTFDDALETISNSTEFALFSLEFKSSEHQQHHEMEEQRISQGRSGSFIFSAATLLWCAGWIYLQ